MNAGLVAVMWIAAGFIVAVVFGHMCTTKDGTSSGRHSGLDVVHDSVEMDVEKHRYQRTFHVG